ncbi:MAG TPA: D-Ala-D-Ala carboxypeptidase family metallohydrolase, partial [Bacteroidota bacterium]|nr:D-Ala-D-Ala carboxypeptidase family metallohydrolase [Bacteroidota bacterium]
HSAAVGGYPTDAHTQIPCTAFDIACADSIARWKIVFALKQAGFPRIGINTKNNHVHCDCDRTKPQFVLFEE